ncbi:MAG: DUF4412 domain-containing protein [Chlorobium sp.]|jgi:hypothetical protein|uniref:DUF4412 domain-containing protein n=1 Tax=Chlorobium sp. TaxID=1095 RepID=UPI001DCC7386|nr:DUF4412 domain-containing protein [Chlorobium sp.]MBN1279188.1 DUF4412 domain-containing protein [Chlorobiaceae bacterium]MCF8216393.1 DUF4412 domain-containing protein [Chlorobium sp.]MCF8271296.1 DUF4412 domain-containing protein [Chlorobium sp.]MCF8287670.1 DUF4412 domain-containing protein [Chlorobium sp.]MCF8291203.1 DUF4412 domain-containing protein [Chlorobium sp.]
MRKLIPVFVLALFIVFSFGACGSGSKDVENNAAESGGTGGSLLPFSREFEGILTMRTTMPDAGSSEMKMFIAEEGMRMETTSNIKNMPEGMRMVILSPAATPNMVYLINDANKSYTIIDTKDPDDGDMDDIDKDPYEDARIEKLGKETVNGYSCNHVRITEGDSVMDMWVSKDVLDYSTFARMQGARDKDMPTYAAGLRKAGLDGFPVKIVQSPSNITTELVSVEKKGLDADLFSLPAGYSKTQLPTMNYDFSPEQR